MNKKINLKSLTKKTRIMFCTTHWLTGGMERKMSNLFNGLVSDFDIYLITVGDSNSVINIPKRVKKIAISQAEFLKNYSDAVFDQVKKNNIDIVVGVANLFPGQLDLYDKCHQAGIKTIAANSEYFFYPHKNEYFYSIIHRRQEIFKCVDAVLWQTNFSAAVYDRINNNGYVMPNPNSFSKQAKIADKKEKIILCVGRFNDYIKRVDRALSCFSLVLKKEPNSTLWLVGPCDTKAKIEKLGNRSIDDMIEEYKINRSKIIFIGEVGDVEKYYHKAGVFLLTSENEGFANVINEAACFGLPIVCNDIPGIEDLVKDEYNGLISDQDDIEGLAKGICKIFLDYELRKKLGDNAVRHSSQFSVDKIMNKWKLVIDFVISLSNRTTIKKELDAELKPIINDECKFNFVLAKEIENSFIILCKEYSIVYKKLYEKDVAQKYLSDELNGARLELAEMVSQNDSLANQLSSIKFELASVYSSKRWVIAERIISYKKRFLK